MADANFPYTVAAGALSEFLAKLKTLAVPPKIDSTYLASIGFASSNHRAFVPVLKSVGLLDSSGVPNERYRLGIRGGDGSLIAEGIRQGYKPLFDVYPNAESMSTTDLQKFIGAHSSYGERALGAAITTFQTLCKFGDFGATPTAIPALPAGGGQSGASGGGSPASQQVQQNPPPAGSVTINVNIALSVDATSDPKVYDAFFAAMAKHIKVLDGSAKSS